MTVDLSPYVVFRRSRLPVTELDDLTFSETWRHVDDLVRCRQELAALGDGLSDELGAIVPRLEGRERSALLSLRRDVHNGRVDRVREALVDRPSAVDGSVTEAVHRWARAADDVAAAESAMRRSLRDETTRATARFPALFAHDAMARSIQLSGEQLFRGLRDFVDPGSSPLKASKARVRESSLVNFAYRAAMKPSPFGRFTEIGAFPPHDPEAGSAEPHPTGAPRPDEGDVSVATVNRLLVNWVLAALPRLPGGLAAGQLVLNSTLVRSDDVVEFVGVVPGTHVEGQMAVEQVVQLRREPLVDAIVEAMPGGSIPGADLVTVVARLTGEAAATDVVHALVRAGILFFRPDVDDHDADYLARLLDDVPETTSELVELRRQVRRLLRLETDFPAAGTDERQRLLADAHEAVQAIAALAGVSVPPESVLRSPVFEDTPATTPPQAWDVGAAESSIDSLSSLWSLASLLDNGQVKRLSLHAFTSRVLDGRATMPFLEFFRAYSSLDEEAQLAVVLGVGVPEAETFRRQRSVALRAVRESMVGDSESVHVDPAVIEAAVAGVTDLSRTESITFRTQFARDVLPGRSETLVVNGALTGYGVYFSRFGSFVEGTEGWSLSRAQRDHLGSRFPDVVDLNSVLGFNFNLHPPVTDRVVDYPGAVTRRTGRPSLALSQLEVVADPVARTVRLFDPVAGQPVDLVPMNFLTPVGVPLLYRLLESLTPSNRYLWKPYDDILDDDERRPGAAPRLVVGDVVAERRSWVVEAADVPDLEALSRGDAEALVRFDAWRRDGGLPQHAFVLSQTREERDVMAGRGRRATRTWADFAHMRKASVHKPMYVDFRNPLLVRSVAKSALTRPDVVLEIRECLPHPDGYRGGGDASSVEEYFVELTRHD